MKQGQKEGENLEFRGRIRGWAEDSKRNWCNYSVQKSDSNLRAELLGERQKDVLFIPRAWYPEDIQIDSAPGWWYVPEESVVGRLCKCCNTFREKAEFTSNEWIRMIKSSCRKCKPENRKCI